MRIYIGFAVLWISFSQVAVAAEEVEKIITETSVSNENQEDPKKIDENGLGIGTWGLGFALGIEQYREPYIETASIQGDGENERIVTTERSIETRPSAWMTINWNLKPFGKTTMKMRGSDDASKKWGFFAGVKLLGESTEVFSAFALGPQITFLTTNNREISVGIGWVTHPTRTFAGNIVEGESLPTQFDDIVFEESTENSFIVMMSVGVL